MATPENFARPLVDKKYVSDLNGLTFLVPDYQRGYRWGAREVKQLLTDLYEFDDRSGDYCLQPIVVRQTENDDVFELIDGQQRLTTIYLILLYLKHLWDHLFPLPTYFNITYQTRIESANYLHDIANLDNDDEMPSNPDAYFMCQAFKAIRDWTNENGRGIDCLVELSPKLRNHVLLLWYEVPDIATNLEDIDDERKRSLRRQQGIALFRRLNIGRIPLTNAELIKSLLLSDRNIEGDRVLRDEIARVWDSFERRLQDDRFWSFLLDRTSSTYSESTRIDLIFDIWYALQTQDAETSAPIDPLRSFLKASSYVDEAQQRADKKRREKRNGDGILREEIRQIWSSICDIFSSLVDWYEDNKLYHRIGYLIATKSTTIPELMKEFMNSRMRRPDFEKSISDHIKESLGRYRSREEISQLTYSEYKEHEYIQKILLLFNIETLLTSPAPAQRFPFEV